MQERCPDSKPKLTATLPNYKLIFVGWSRQWRCGVASIKPFRGERVPGGVYEITEKCLRQLDKFEGYPSVYDRMKVIVFDENNQAIEAITYFRAGQVEETQPAREYLTTIQQGYRDWGII